MEDVCKNQSLILDLILGSYYRIEVQSDVKQDLFCSIHLHKTCGRTLKPTVVDDLAIIHVKEHIRYAV